MNQNRLMKQFTAIFSIFMVFFYLGVGTYFIFFSEFSTLDKAVLVLMGSTFLFYGVYRAYRAYINVIEAFFTKDKD